MINLGRGRGSDVSEDMAAHVLSRFGFDDEKIGVLSPRLWSAGVYVSSYLPLKYFRPSVNLL